MRILLVCESSHILESGGRVVRYITKILSRDNNQVKVLVLSEKRDDLNLGTFYQEYNVEFLPIRRQIFDRFKSLFFRTHEIKSFEKILRNYSPEVVHFASFDHSKPSQFFNCVKKQGVKVVLQPWTMHFYCSQGFGFREGKQCTLCASGNYLNALTKKCISLREIPSLIEKKITHKRALNADLFLSSNSELDKILNKYGVEKNAIYRFPIAFDYTFLSEKPKNEKDYFIFYGQANSHKGLSVLLDVFKKLPNKKIKIYPISKLSENTSRYENIEIINGINWTNGLSESILNSKAVIMPSLWSTSTEYALCEALLMKKAVVVFNVGVHKDIFKNGHDAIVVEPDDLDSFTNAILELDTNKQLRDSLGKNGYDTLLKINNPDELYSKLIKGYSSNNI